MTIKQLKYCPSCQRNLEISCFYKSKQTKDGLYGFCKECSKRYKQNKEYFKEYYHSKGHKSFVKYRKSNKRKEAERKYNKSEKGKICRKKSYRKYIESGKLSKRNKERYDSDINFRIKRLLRIRVSLALKNSQKSGHTLNLLGCSVEELKTHLEMQFEPGMTWENLGKGEGKWQIDHVIPCSYFDLTKEENQRICFNYRNLQPLWAKDNLEKSNSVSDNVEELVEFLKQEILI